VAERGVDLLGGRERLLWIGFSGAETVAARPVAGSGQPAG
jgi:hypothetical protein